MTSIITIAASKAIKAKDAKAARPDVGVGQHRVDFWLRITGLVKVGEDYETAPTVAIPYKRAFAALCKISGCTGKAGINKIRQAMEIALSDDTDETAKDALSNIEDIERIEREIIDPMLQSLPKLDCKGKVTTDLEVEIREVE